MMSEAPGPLNFTMFLTLFGEKLTGTYVPGMECMANLYISVLYISPVTSDLPFYGTLAKNVGVHIK